MQYLEAHEAVFDVLVLEQPRGRRHCRVSVLESNTPQGQVDRFGIVAFQRLATCLGFIEIRLHPFDRAADDARAYRVPLQTQPDVDGTHGGAEADQILVQDQLQHAAEGVGVGLVDCLQDCLAEPLLALGGQQHFFHEFPGVGIRAGQQAPGHVPAHAADFMLSGGRIAKHFQNLLRFATARVDGSGEQYSQFVLRSSPGTQMRRPSRQPGYVLVVILKFFAESPKPFAPPGPSGGLVAGGAKRLALPVGLVG